MSYSQARSFNESSSGFHLVVFIGFPHGMRLRKMSLENLLAYVGSPGSEETDSHTEGSQRLRQPSIWKIK